MRTAVLTATVALAIASPSFSAAQTAQPPAKRPQQEMKGAAAKQASDQTFVMKAAKGGMAEVELGKLAQEKGASDQVKNFGKRMVDDHSKANEELQALAPKKNITLTADLDPKDKALKDRLSKLSGPAFDRAYMSAMLQDHRKDIAEFHAEAARGQDPDVKAFAAKTLPTLEEHLRLAKQLNKSSKED